MHNDFLKPNKDLPFQCIKVYTGGEIVQDPFEKNVEVTLFNPTIVPDVLVEDLIASQISWKLPGVRTEKAKNLQMGKQYRSLIESSQRIDIHENGKLIPFEGWRVNGRMQIREEGQFIRVYVFSRTVDTP